MGDYGQYYEDFEEVEDYVIEQDYDREHEQDLCDLFGEGE